jgi:hypothetical protein
MKMKTVIYLLAFVLLHPHPVVSSLQAQSVGPADNQDWSTPEERPVEQGRWLCWMYSGKGKWTRVIRDAFPMDYFIKNLAAFDQEIRFRVEHDPEYATITAEIKPVGRLAGQRVLDVFFRHLVAEKVFGKMILIGDEERYKPVVWMLDDLVDAFSDSEVVHFPTGDILGTRSHHTRSYYFEDYFVFDRVQRIPINLRVDVLIRTTTSKMGCSAWVDGGFDLGTLTFRSVDFKQGGIWRNGECELRLDLKDNALIQKSFRRIPPPQRPDESSPKPNPRVHPAGAKNKSAPDG